MYGLIFIFLDIKNLKVKIRKYAPLVFHHIRKFDEITLDLCLNSLNPDSNIQNLTDNFASGGRSDQPIYIF